MTRLSIACLLLLMAGGFAPAVAKDQTTFVVCSDDTEINQHVNYSVTPHGNKPSMRIRKYSPKYRNPVESPVSHGLLRWDLSEIPHAAKVLAVELRMQLADASAGQIAVYALEGWTWNESDATWKSYEAASPVETRLGVFTGVPVGISAGNRRPYSKGPTIFGGSELKQAVQKWIDKPETNCGLVLKWDGAADQGDDFLTKEKDSDFIKPTLVVTWREADQTATDTAAETGANTATAGPRLLKGYSGNVHVVMDLDYDMICFPLTREILAAKMRFLAEHGFRRIYIVAPPPDGTDYSVSIAPWLKHIHLETSRHNISEPLKFAVQDAKAAGMEVFVQFKPYEGGGTRTVPHGVEPPSGRNWLECLGGRAVGLDPFIVGHPDMRVRRKPCDARLATALERLEIVFLLGRKPGREGLDSHLRIEQRADWPAISPEALEGYPVRSATIYTSQDNAAYKLLPEKLHYESRLERRLLRDANGQLLFSTPQLCRIVTISGFSTTAPYLAVKLDTDAEACRLIPWSESFLTGFDAQGAALPLTATSTVRPGTLTRKNGFEENGFEFNEIGPFYWDEGWKKANLVGIARGKDEYVRGDLCEAYPEVRAYWLRQIKTFIEMGCDGVDLRLMSHSSGIPDFIQYGYNAPVAAEYARRHGHPMTEEADPFEIMRIRGDFFTQFVKEAAALLHAAGRRLSVQFHDFQTMPTLDPTFPGLGFWANPKILPDVQELISLCDEAVIKDFNWGVYTPWDASPIKDAVVAAGKPLYVTAYLEQGHDLNPEFLKAAEQDKRLTGIAIYEAVYRPGRTQDGIVDLHPDGTPYLVPDCPFDRLRRK